MSKTKIKIITDSTTSLSKEECEKLGIDCLETSYMLDDVNYSAFENDEESLIDFYKRLDEIKSCSTGCVNEHQFEECFEKWIKQGYQVIYMGLSSALSSTHENACNVAKRLNHNYGENKVFCVDTKTGSYGSYLFVEEALEMVAEGKSADEIAEKLSDDANNKMETSFVPRDLNFLCKSGRLSRLEASIGRLMRLVPIISVSQPTGKLAVSEKCIGTKLAMKTVKNKYVKLITTKGLTRCMIATSGLEAEAEELKAHIIANTDIKDIKVGLIDKTMACCCGPKTIAIFCK